MRHINTHQSHPHNSAQLNSTALFCSVLSRELEILLQDLQENMRKRNPDSVSNLIHAAKQSDEELIEQKEQMQLIADLRSELAGRNKDKDKIKIRIEIKVKTEIEININIMELLIFKI